MKTCYIYTLSDPRNDKVRYVGKTNNPKQRRSAHGVLTREQRSRKKNWVKQLKSLGLKPAFEIVEEVSIDDWKEAEKFWIIQFKAWGFKLLNHTSGGDGLTFGNNTSFKKGQVSWNKGKAFKKVCLECGKEYNISPSRAEKSVGCSRKCSVSYRKKNKLFKGVFQKNHDTWNKNKSGYSTKKKGVPLPQEVKQKISKTMKGRPNLRKRIVEQYSKEMVLLNTYPSIIEAAQATGVKGIRNVLTGRAKTAGGYIWQ